MNGVNDTSSDRPQNPDDLAAQPRDAIPAEDAQQSLEEAPENVEPEQEAEEQAEAPVPAEFFRIKDERSRGAAVDAARRELARHQVVVMPTDTVYGIAANAFSAEAVQRLLEAKGRDRTMPPPVLIAHSGVLDGLADSVSEEARALAGAFWPGGLTLICHAQASLQWDLGETRGTVALRVPDDPVAQQLLQETGPLAVSSANRTGMTAAVTAEQAREMLGDSVRVYLEDGPRTEGMDPAGEGTADAQPVASTIVDCTGGVPVVVRDGRISLTRLREVVPSVIARDGSSAPSDAEDETAQPDAVSSADGEAADESSVRDPGQRSQDASGKQTGPDQDPAGADEPSGPQGRHAGSGGSTVADPEIGIVEQARAEQDSAAPGPEDFAGASAATGVSAAAAVVAAGGGGGRHGAPDQNRTRPQRRDPESTRPLGVAQASALVARAVPEDQAEASLPQAGVDQQR